MKIGIALFNFSLDYIGGVRTYVNNLLINLIREFPHNEYFLFIQPRTRSYFEHLFAANNLNTANVVYVTYALGGFLSRLTLAVIKRIPNAGNLLTIGGRWLARLIDSRKLDVVHFPCSIMYPMGVKTPTVLSPHDIQQEHFPQFFTPKELEYRRRTYKPSCEQATAIVVASQFIKDDLIQHYSLNPAKIHVVTLAADPSYAQPVTEEWVRKVKEKYRLPTRFIFYPAMIWPHKNHVRLIKAISLIKKNSQCDIPLILTGSKYGGYNDLIKIIDQEKLESQVLFLEEVTRSELAVIYKISDFVVVPTLFEASSFVIMEAFAARTPVIASNIPPVTELVNNSALIFDPYHVEDIADKILQIWNNEELRNNLRHKAKEMSQKISWGLTAQKTNRVYEWAAQQNMK